jgi:hypothetical protein
MSDPKTVTSYPLLHIYRMATPLFNNKIELETLADLPCRAANSVLYLIPREVMGAHRLHRRHGARRPQCPQYALIFTECHRTSRSLHKLGQEPRPFGAGIRALCMRGFGLCGVPNGYTRRARVYRAHCRYRTGFATIASVCVPLIWFHGLGIFATLESRVWR